MNHELPELARQLAPVKRPNPLLWLYHWRYEILALTVLPYALVNLVLWLGPVWSLVALAAAFNWVFYWRAARRHLRGRLRAIVVQHRLRTAFASARICTVDGSRPAILWTRPLDGDVVVSLFCPAGIGFDQIHSRREVLADACFATEIYVDRHPKYGALVTLTICAKKPRSEPGRAVSPGEVVPLRVHS
ncbi:hypothetical protein SAMN05421837_106601 [Amycolatopsis pretoriensis]|uniref:Uncharacterized protein n=1 Tax=Amycolatopsis pretoriensis TaxID=218821 RepID=A0A1H5R4Y1_9PSEU|nr:hypothetical protein [Amycolatopsis pretoriensis]SEF33104.1 hypothetical protein SAMN05421837_106601 [Amycolatopsis pretoriensis]